MVPVMIIPRLNETEVISTSIESEKQKTSQNSLGNDHEGGVNGGESREEGKVEEEEGSRLNAHETRSSAILSPTSAV